MKMENIVNHWLTSYGISFVLFNVFLLLIGFEHFKHGDISNWFALLLEFGIGFPIAFYIGKYFLLREIKITKEKKRDDVGYAFLNLISSLGGIINYPEKYKDGSLMKNQITNEINRILHSDEYQFLSNLLFAIQESLDKIEHSEGSYQKSKALELKQDLLIFSKYLAFPSSPFSITENDDSIIIEFKNVKQTFFK